MVRSGTVWKTPEKRRTSPPASEAAARDAEPPERGEGEEEDERDVEEEEPGRPDERHEPRAGPEDRGVRVGGERAPRAGSVVPERQLSGGEEARGDVAQRDEEEPRVARDDAPAEEVVVEPDGGGAEERRGSGEGSEPGEAPRRHAFRARTRSDIPNDGSVFSSSFSSGRSHRNAASCPFGRTFRFRTLELSHQPRTPGRFRKRIFSTSNPASVTRRFSSSRSYRRKWWRWTSSVP